MSIELTFTEQPLLKDKRGSMYVQVATATEIQIKELVLTGCVVLEKEDGVLPFFIESIGDAPFFVRTDLTGLIAVLSVFDNQDVDVFTNRKKKKLVPQELTKFIFS